MGTSGHGNFENDAALDWVGDLAEHSGRGTAALVKAMRGYLKGKGEIEEALAAVEIIAALQGHPSQDLPQSAQNYVLKKIRTAIDETQTVLAREVVNKALQDDEFLSTFFDDSDAEDWKKTQELLLKRLEASHKPFKPRDFPKTRATWQPPKKVIAVRGIHDGNNIVSGFQYAGSDSLPPLDKPVDFPGGLRITDINTVCLNLQNGFDHDECVSIARWLESYPGIMLEIPIRVADEEEDILPLDVDMLILFSKVRALTIEMSQTHPITFLEQFQNLRFIQIEHKQKRKKLSLTPLASLKGLQALGLKGKFSDSSTLGELSSLCAFEAVDSVFDSDPLQHLNKGLSFLSLHATNFEPVELHKYQGLQALELSNSNLESITNLDFLKSLKELASLYLYGLPLFSLDGLSMAVNLRHLRIDSLEYLQSIAEVSSLRHLETLRLFRLPKLNESAQLYLLSKLHYIHAVGLPASFHFLDLLLAPNLRELLLLHIKTELASEEILKTLKPLPLKKITLLLERKTGENFGADLRKILGLSLSDVSSWPERPLFQDSRNKNLFCPISGSGVGNITCSAL